jgi:Bacterial HORMA domain 2
MSTSTFVVSYAYTVTYVTTKMLLLLKEIIREIGLDPGKFANDWNTYEDGIRTWLASRHLQQIRLEVYDPKTNALATFWDIDVVYASVGGGSLWVDTAAIRYAIFKAGLAPASCRYDVKLTNSPGYERIYGWRECELRSTDGFKRYVVGSAVGGNGISAQVAYWSR